MNMREKGALVEDIAEKYLVNKPLQEELYKEYIKLTDVVSKHTK